jgi:nitrite reductase/ring-hydroxylating ferredoxin subunit/thioredoxin reductase
VSEASAASGPDLSAGIRLNDIAEGATVAGRVGDEAVLLSRFEGDLYAVSGTCTHYGGHLADGLTRGTNVRCPLHHACFDLKTGRALRAPALDPLDRWQVDVDSERAYVSYKLQPQSGSSGDVQTGVRRIVILGGGAAGLACANELRELGITGDITMLSADSDPPCDRPNLSKDYLAGTAPEEWLWLRSDGWYAENRVELRLSTEVTRIDPAERLVHCASGEPVPFDRLLIATGAEPNRLPGSGFDRPNVHMLRSVADARAIAGAAKEGSRAVIIGASFIALEVAASLRHRSVHVDIVSVEEVPLEHVFGREIGQKLQALHETNGVRFHLSAVVESFDGKAVVLGGGERIDADFVVVGIGVRPRIAVAQDAGAAVDKG